ncbi:putative transferrin receptor protein 1 [Rosellinia necatrix]|uniref:Putative transferrin receptor protein 1 n=1 Tax=Rosellinia necatrix TaxID=77044 RepID=A0A1S7UL34_ROSNE|nr:putative transferrin receptor protein 1 [Rosellinia necatrix]
MHKRNIFHFLCLSPAQAFSPPLARQREAAQHPMSPGNDTSCLTSYTSRYDMVRGRSQVPMLTSDGRGRAWGQPAIPALNSTAGEQWEFDGVSADGAQAFIFGVYRDPNYAFLGTGNLRAYVELAPGDGPRYAVVDYAEEAAVTTCPGGGGTRGVWRGPGFAYTFYVAEDMSRARWTMESAEANATVEMRSLSRPRYPDNTMWSRDGAPGDLAVVPHFYWAEPIPAAEVRVQVTMRDRRYSWVGVGGHERLWGAFNWRTCLRSLKIVRFQAGPYSLSLWEFGSSRAPDTTFSSVAMFEDGEKIFGVAGTSRGDPAAEVEEVEEENGNRIVLRKLYGGEGITTENLKDKVTGVELRLVQPSRQLEWVFTVTFKKVGFEYVLTEGRGGTGYAGIVSGGPVEGQDAQMEVGPAFVEIMRFPDGDWWLLPDNYIE